MAFLILFLLLAVGGCKKYLDKPNLKSYVIPSTLEDLQALLNNDVMYTFNSGFLEGGGDNYYVTTNDWQNALAVSGSPLPTYCMNYIWDKDADNISTWYNIYTQVYYCNLVLDALPSITVNDANKDTWNVIKGSALYYRSMSFYNIAQLYCKPYSSSAASDLGIPLRNTSDINEKTVRSTVEETYNQLIADLKIAVNLLPETSTYITRPTKAAAYGALARTYLSMRDYSNAGRFADSCLKRNSALIDYNTLLPVKNPPLPTNNPEVVDYSYNGIGDSFIYQPIALVDSVLYQSYATSDLRKSIFFKPNPNLSGTYWFQGGYAVATIGTTPYSFKVFTGITTDEMYLTRSECYARAGNTNAALSDLNTLMIKRWKNDGSYVPYTASIASDALEKILIERRKELCFRGLRWSDLRRLNLEGANINLKRIIGGTTYTLPANDLRWVLLIPKNVINLSGIPQNPR